MGYYDDYFQGVRSTQTKLGARAETYLNKKYLDVLQKIAPLENRTVLEIGPGRSPLINFVEDKATVHYFCVEINEYQCRKLKESKINTIRSSAPSLPLKGGSVDCILLIHTLEHMVDYERVLALVEECKRVLKAGGYIYMVSPNFFVWGDEFWNADYSHSFVTSNRRITQLCRDEGLAIALNTNMTFGITNAFLRIPLNILVKLFPWRLFDFIARVITRNKDFEFFYRTRGFFGLEFSVVLAQKGK